jgi:Fibronectin type III domain
MFGLMGWTAHASAVKSPDAPLPQSDLSDVSCVSAMNCTAVGGYGHGPLLLPDGSNYLPVAANFRPIYATKTAGIWGNAIALPSPPATLFTGVSCTSAATCTAVGYDYSGHWDAHADELLRYPIYATEIAGRWGPVSQITSVGDVGFTSVSCVSAADCTAVGLNAIIPPATAGPIVASETAGSWGSVTILKTPTGLGDLYGVSCTSAANCTAVGEDLNIDETVGVFTQGEPIHATESDGTWGPAVEVTTPSSTGYLSGVSCISAAGCTAVGGDGNAFYVAESSGTWGSAVDVDAPKGGALEDVSCTTVSGCTAVGGTESRDVYVTETSGTWGPATVDGSGASSGVSCTSATDCTAVGAYGMCAAYTCRGPSDYAVYVTDNAGVWPTVPSAPRGIRASPRRRSIMVSWVAGTKDGGSAVTGYTASATTKSDGKSHESLCASTTSRCTITGLTNNRTYTVTVYERNAAGISVSSATRRVVPHAPR